MTNATISTKTNVQIATETPYLFLEDSHENYDNKILVLKKEWFSETPLCQTYNDYGQLAVNDMDGEHNGKDCCETVKAHDFWNGSNHNTIILTNEFDTRYSEVTDDDEIAKYVELVEKAETDDFYANGTGYQSCDIDGFRVTESQWQGDFEIYSITEIED